MRVGFVSLGCSKNQVNCEQMMWKTFDAGYDIALEAEDCDVAVLNTCGFLQEAKEEALAEYETLAKMKQEGRLQHIIVVGCMAQRYKDELEMLCPEADGFVGCGSYQNITDVIEAAKEQKQAYLFESIDAPIPEIDRVIVTSDHWAWLRIAEGCDNRCAYCTIPFIRGKYRSRPMEKILDEVKSMAECGIREIMVVAQDITRYGYDLYGKTQLVELLKEICKVEGIEWVRLHYAYPDALDDALIDLIATEDKIVKYLDIPIQHISTPVLARMKRRGTGEEVREVLAKLRKRVPDIVLRTSLIAGFPGETEEDFEELSVFLREFRIQRAGIFAFSPEEGSAAFYMDDQIEDEVKRRRVELLTDIQMQVIDDYCEAQLGKTKTVLCEGYMPDLNMYVGRSEAESPHIDGSFYLVSDTELEIGKFYHVEVTAVEDGELIGTVKGDAF